MFEEPVIRRYPFDVTFTAEEYALNLSTQSAVKELEPRAQFELIRRIRDRVVAEGGTITAHLLAMLTVAQTRG